jgi:hypothetical protein
MDRFARRVFLVAGIYGLIVMVPQYWMAERVGRDTPPPLTHPEFFFGFVGLAIAWQVCFLLISRDPVRLRPIMLACVLEKLAWAIPGAIFFAQHRIAPTLFVFAMIDLLLGALFAIAYARTPAAR